MSSPVSAEPVRYQFVRHDRTCATLSFPANAGHVTMALQDLADHLKAQGCASGLIDDGTIVLAEVLNNVEEHAYGGRSGAPVTVRLEAQAAALRYVVEDRGRRYPKDQLPDAEMPASHRDDLDGLPEGGFGWPLVRKLTSEVSYTRDGDTNRLVFCLPARPWVPDGSEQPDTRT